MTVQQEIGERKRNTENSIWKNIKEYIYYFYATA